MEVDFWANHYDLQDQEDGGASEEYEDDDFDVDAEIAKLDGDDWEEVSLGGGTGD
jgi:hypothetical protein